ncbi:MAG: LysR family transcriptional regulator [Pseudomonadota bacterium]
MNLTSISVFVQIVEQGSLAAAARELNLSTTTVSERLASLEAHYGARLLNRTTRSLSLTKEGELLFDGARRMLSDARQLEDSIRHGVASISGPIRMSMPSDLGVRYVLPVVDRFLKKYPEVEIDIIVSDENSDFTQLGLDFAIRDQARTDASLTISHLIDNQRVVIGSPDYLARMGRPEHPLDLVQHECLILRVGLYTNRFWRFIFDGEEQGVSLNPARITNDAGLVAEWCRAGHGLAVKSAINVADDLESGALIPVMTEFMPPPGAFQIVHGAGRNPPQRVSLLIETIRTELSQTLTDVKARLGPKGPWD